jgi:thioredoxin reductase (NADPH)
VGGGNSAGQAALFLSRSSAQVHVIIRGETLAASMSRYLIDQIERNPRITVTTRTQVTALIGKDQLEGVELVDTSRQQRSALAVRGLFVFIAATAIGEGSMAVRLVFERLRTTGSAVADPPRPDGDGPNPRLDTTHGPV